MKNEKKIKKILLHHCGPRIAVFAFVVVVVVVAVVVNAQ
jgi:hypothetical protein